MPTKQIERRPQPTTYDSVEVQTFSKQEVITALRRHYNLDRNARIELTAETYDADPYQSSVMGPGRLAARGTGARVEIKTASGSKQ